MNVNVFDFRRGVELQILKSVPLLFKNIRVVLAKIISAWEANIKTVVTILQPGLLTPRQRLNNFSFKLESQHEYTMVKRTSTTT